jgi:hypothetical protein
MNQIVANIKSMLTNLHVSVPALIGFILAVLPVWFPKYETQLRATAGFAFAYGLTASANTPPSSTTPPTTKP